MQNPGVIDFRVFFKMATKNLRKTAKDFFLVDFYNFIDSFFQQKKSSIYVSRSQFNAESEPIHRFH